MRIPVDFFGRLDRLRRGSLPDFPDDAEDADELDDTDDTDEACDRDRGWNPLPRGESRSLNDWAATDVRVSRLENDALVKLVPGPEEGPDTETPVGGPVERPEGGLEERPVGRPAGRPAGSPMGFTAAWPVESGGGVGNGSAPNERRGSPPRGVPACACACDP